MSKEELGKWENKLKVWAALHPEDNLWNCKKVCPYSSRKGNCKDIHTLALVGDLVNGRPAGKYKLLYLLWSEAQTMYNNAMTNGERKKIVLGCVEWIKYV